MEIVQCSICDEVSDKTMLKVYNPGRLLHKSSKPEALTTSQNTINSTMDKTDSVQKCCLDNTVSKCRTISLRNKHFAGGDHQQCCVCFKDMTQHEDLNMNNTVSIQKPIKDRPSISGENKKIGSKTAKTTVKYKNFNFGDSESIVSVNEFNENETIKDTPEITENVIHRPITCPISDCQKMIARASVLQHFIFDHSKIPRIPLDISEQRVLINVSDITEKLNCYAIILDRFDSQSAHTLDYYNQMNGQKNASFLLMGVRMQSAETIKKLHGSKRVSIRHVQTQTEDLRKSSKINLNNIAVIEELTDVGREVRYLIDNQDILLLWLCKLVNNLEFYYTISIQRPDKKLGFSFTGETLHIGEFLPNTQKDIECLRILERTLKNLVNEQNELEVNVNIFL